MTDPTLYSNLTQSERGEAIIYAKIMSPTLFQIRQLIRYYIADTRGVYIRVVPRADETNKLIKAYETAKKHFQNL